MSTKARKHHQYKGFGNAQKVMYVHKRSKVYAICVTAGT